WLSGGICAFGDPPVHSPKPSLAAAVVRAACPGQGDPPSDVRCERADQERVHARSYHTEQTGLVGMPAPVDGPDECNTQGNVRDSPDQRVHKHAQHADAPLLVRQRLQPSYPSGRPLLSCGTIYVHSMAWLGPG